MIYVGGRPRGARDDRAAARVRPSRGALRALPRRGEPAPPRGRRVGASSRPRERRGRAPRVRAAARERDPLGDPNISAAGVRHGDALPAPCRGNRAALRRADGRGCRRPPARPARPAAATRRRPELLSRGVPARRVSRRRLAVARPLASSRAAHRLDRVGRAARPPGRRPRASSSRSPRARATPSPTRRAGRRSGRCSRSWEPPRPCSRSRSARSSPRRASAPTGSRTPTTRISSARAARLDVSSRRWRSCARTTSSQTCPIALQEAAELRLRHPTASLRELAARAPSRPRPRRRCTGACAPSRSSRKTHG